MSVETKIRNLITEINEATGQNDSNLSNAIATLKKGYLGDAVLQSKRVNVTQNGAKVITPDEGYNALSQVIVTTSVTEEEIDPDAFHAYYVEYDPTVADYKKVWICRLSGGEVINVKEGTDVDESNVGTSDYNPALIFKGWSCPLPIINNQVTIPDVICADVYIGAIYDTVDGQTYYVADDGQVYNDVPDTDVCVKGIYYTDGITEAEDLRRYSSIERVTLPSTLYSLPKCMADRLCFQYLVIPYKVTSIGETVFRGCPELQVVVLPNSLISIGLGSFYNVPKVHSVLLPYGVTEITENLFAYSNIKGIDIEAETASYMDNCFSDCDVEYIKLSDKLDSHKNIDTIFRGCHNLKRFKTALASYEGRVLEMADKTIAVAGTIKEFTLTKPMSQYIAWYRIWKLNITTSLWRTQTFLDSAPHWLHIDDEGVIPDSNYSITGESVSSTTDAPYYSGSLFLRRLTGPVTSVGNRAFYKCGALSYASLENVTYVGENAFSRTALKHFTFGKVISIGNDAFSYTQLRSIYAPLLENIGNKVFSYCDELSEINMPAVKTVGASAFVGSFITGAKIHLPAVESIGVNAFKGPSSGGSRVLYVRLGKNITNIATYALGDSTGNSYYQRTFFLVVEAETPPTLAGKLTSNTTYAKAIYVPDESVDAYKAATNWSAYSSVIKPLSEFTGDW